MNKTPRTDAFASEVRGLGTGYYQALDEMRKLEHELAAEKKELEQWIQHCNEHSKARADLEAEIAELKEANSQLAQDAEDNYTQGIRKGLSESERERNKLQKRVCELEKKLEMIHDESRITYIS